MANPLPPPGGPPPPLPSSLPPAPPLPGSAAQSRSDSNVLSGIMNAPRPPGTTPGVAPLAPTSALPSVPLTAKAPAPLPQAPPGATQLPLQSRSDTNILSGIMGGSPPLPSSAPPLPPPASVPPPQVPTSGTSVSAQNRSDSSILSGIMGGSRPFAGTSVSAPLAPTSATALPPPASLPPSQATVPSSTAFDPPLPGGPRQKPPPIQTSLTPRPPAGSSSQDSAVLNTIIGKAPSTTMQSVPMPSGQASSFAPLASQSQSQASKDGAVLGALLGGSQALPSQTITSQASKDGAVLGSLMGSQPPSLAPLGNQNVTSQERRDGAVLGSLMASPPSPTFSPLASQQVRNKDAAVLGSLMGGRESRDDAILTQTMEGTFASQSAISQARMDGAVLGSLMGQGRESRDDAILMQTMQGLRSDPLGYVANQQSRDDAAIRQLVPEYDATDDAAMARLIGGPVEQLRRDDDALGALMQREYDEIASQAGAHSSPNRVGMRRRNAGVTNARNAALAKRLGRPHGAAMPRRTRVTGPRQGPTRDILEERAKVSMEQENATLRRAKLEMKSKVQELEVKLRRLKSTDGKEGIAKAREIDAMAEVESLAKALKLGAPQAQRSGPPAMHRGQRTQGPASAQPRQRHSSQPGQRRLGGRLQRRTEQKPWGPHDELQLSSPKAAGSWMQSNQPPVTLADSLRQSAQFRSASPPNRGPYPSSAPAMPQPFVSMPPRMQDSAHGYAPTSSPPLGPLVPANVTPPALAQDFPFFPLPEIKPLEMPSSPTTALPPLSMLDTGAISSPGVGEDEYTRRLREEEHALREQKHQLDEQLENLIVGRMGEYKIARNYKDRLKTKEGRIKNLERELEREQRKASQSRESLERAKNETQTHLTVARDRVHRMGAGLGVAEDVTPLQQQLQALKDANRLLTKDIRDLTVGAFCNSANQRVVTHQKIDEIERQKAEKEQDSEKLRADQARIEAECYQASLDVTALDDECRKLMEDNERWEIRIEEKEEAVRRAVDAYKGIMDNLEPEDRDVLNFSLQFLKDREARNNNQQLLERVVQGAARSPVPSDAASLTASRATLGGIGKQRSVEETTHVVESLRAQKAELAQEIVAIKAIIQREQAIEKDLKAMHTLDVDELGLQIQVTMEDTDRCKKLALDREKRIQEYRKELVKRQKLAVEQPGRPKPPGTYSERASDVISEAGFSGLTELDGVNNALDIYLTVGRVEERALLELPRRPNGDEVMDEAALVTMIFVEFLHFDVACSEEASTLKPRYDSLLSFGPFEVSDPVVEHFAKGAVRFELQAFAVGGTAAYTLGRAILPLAVMLDCTPQDRNPVVTGTLSFAAESDSRIQIASIQYKARWRTSLLEALSLYAARLGSTPAAIVEAQTAKVGPGAYAAPGLMGAMRTLIVQIRSVTGLQSFRQGVPPEALRPYVSYEVPGHLEHATEVMAGSMCPFQDTHKMSVRIDDDFCRWVNKHPQEGGGLHFVVFDSNVPAGQQPQVGVQSEDMLGVLGEVRIPIGTLLTSPYALVEGAYPLQRAAGFQTIAAGILDVHIRWQDEPSAVVATPGAGAATAFYGAGSSGAMTEEKFQIVWQRVMRRLYAMKLSASDWFNNNDLDKDGRWTKHEARMALSQMPIGLSPYECEQIFERMDSFRRGFVALSDIAGALAEGAKAAPLEQWARDIYRRMAEAMARQGQTAEQAFCAVARGWQAQKREFFALATSLDLGMKPEQLEWLWKLSDTNSDGLLDFREFAARLREVTGMATTAYTLPRPEKDMIDAPGGGSGPACEAGPMTDMRLELCLLGLLRCCQELGWRTVDRVMQEIGGRQGGGISRAVLMTFCLRARARISEWEVDQIVTRLDFDASGAIDERTLRAALFRCALSDAPCQVITRRAMLNIGRMRQGLMDRRLRFAPQVSAVVGIGGLSGASTAAEDLVLVFKSLLEEVVAQKAPLLVTRPEFQKIAQLLGVDRGQAELDELWAFVGKLRDGSLDTVAFMKQVTEMPLPGEGDVDWMSDERFAILMGRVKKALERLSLGGAAKAFDKFRTGSERCLSPLELEAAFTQVLDNLSPHERKLLVARIDANKDGKIDLVELEAALDHANVSALGDWAAGICKRVANSLRRRGKSIDDLFVSLAEGSPVVHWINFEKLFGQMEPSLTSRQLQQLWWAFDKNHDGGVSLDEFRRAFTILEEEAEPDAMTSKTDLLHSPSHRAVDVGTQHVFAAAQPTQAEVNVCARIVNALAGRGQTVDGLFNSLAKQGIVRFEDFVMVFANIEPSLTSQQLDNLWRTFDQDGSGGVCRDEFKRGLSLQRVPQQAFSAARPTQAEVEVCARIVKALKGSGQTVDGLFNSLAKQGIVYFNDFVNVFATMEPSLTNQQLDNLWRTFDQDGSGGVSRDEFQRGLSLRQVPTQTAAATRPTQAEVDVCARIVTALTSSGQTVDGLFNSLAKQGIVYFNDFVSVFAKIEPSLTGQQLDNLWRTFDQDGSGGVSRDEFQRGLSLQKVPMSRPTQAEMDVCARIVTALTGSGQTIDGLFNSLAKQGIVYFNDFVDVFAKIEPSLTNQQLDNLWRTFDQDGSGGVSRDEFQRGLSLRKEVIHQATLPGVSSSSTAQDKEQNVCARIQAVLTREGKSVNDLFNGLANGGETVQLEPFLQMFAKMEPSLTREQLQHLWRSFDSDGSGGVSREEFRRVLNQQNLQPSSTSVLALGPKDVDKDICARVQKVLAEAGKSPDDLFDALAQGGASVRWEPFAEMFTKMESSMTPEQLKHLWQTFDKDGDNSVSREEFRRVLAPQAATGSLSPPTEESVLDRVKRVLQQEGKTADDLFVAMAAGGVAVQRAEFMTLFMDLEPGLTGGQLQHLWGSFDKNGDGMISREEFLRILDPPKAASVARLSGVTNDELIKLLQLIAASSTQREGTIQEQIRAFDVQKTGCLDRVAFDMAMRSYSPTIADDVLTALWAFFGGETADTSALNIEFLATKILSFSDPTMDRMVDIANKDKLVKLLQLMAVCSAQRDGTIQEQLRAFDLQKTGHLDRLAFDMAMRAYSPSIADNLLMDLWTFLGGEAAGALGLNVEYLAAKIMSFRDAAIDRTAEAVGKDKLMKLLQLMAVCSAQRGGTTEEQLRAFDFQKTGRLDRLAFDTAMRAYSPSIADSVLTDLWAFLGGQAAGGSALGVEDLAKTIASFHPTTGRPAILGTPIVGAHGAIGEQAPDTRKSSHGAPCPLDLKPCTLQCLTNVANRLQHEGANGFIDFHKMHIILEANGINVARRTTNRLKPWMCETKDSLAYWPPLLAFCVCIDKITITADKPTRVAYPSLQCEISFCGEVVKLPPFNWSGCGMMPSEPKKISKTLKTHARFNIDGPYCISREDLVVALRPPPQVPPSHCVRVALVGSDMPLDASSSADGSFTYSLGSFELFMQRDLPQLDLREGSVRKIDWHLPGVPGKGPRLHAEISVSTQNVKRIWQKCGF